MVSLDKIVAPELLMEESVDFAGKIAKQTPLAVRLIKESINKAVDYPLNEGMQFERKNFYILFASEDQKEGMKAFVEKRSQNSQADEGCSMYETIKYSVENGVAWLTLNRPDKLNAFTSQMNKEIQKAIKISAGADEVRAIIITGARQGILFGAGFIGC